jgi:serine/threonine protein kinase
MEDYEIQKSIGTGSFGEVFLAKHRSTGRTFVVKKLKVKDLNPKDRENIETEIQCLRDFKHVNIVSYKDSFIDSAGVLNIVMQYC